MKCQICQCNHIRHVGHWFLLTDKQRIGFGIKRKLPSIFVYFELLLSCLFSLNKFYLEKNDYSGNNYTVIANFTANEKQLLQLLENFQNKSFNYLTYNCRHMLLQTIQPLLSKSQSEICFQNLYKFTNISF